MADAADLSSQDDALRRARRKAWRRLVPLLFVCYVVAFVDRTNVAIAKLTMTQELPGFNNAVIGFGAGVFFLGYFLLEIPGTLLVERWSARKWICRIMISWGVVAGLTAAVKTPAQFYWLRFLLGLAEAGFFPGVIVYLSHWFGAKDRARALAAFMAATPVAQVISPKISNALLKIGAAEIVGGKLTRHPAFLGLHGWQWVYLAWAIPAALLGVVVWLALADWPRQAAWLAADERRALEENLARERAQLGADPALKKIGRAIRHPRVLLLAAVYFLVVTGSYGTEFFMPSILENWYALNFNALTWLLILPPLLGMASQLTVGCSSDRWQERRWHTAAPVAVGAAALGLAANTRGHLGLTLVCFMLAYAGFKAFLPIFWTLPSLFLTETAAAGSIGLINSIGNLGGFLGPYLMGTLQHATGSFVGGMRFLSLSMAAAGFLIVWLGLGRQSPPAHWAAAPDPLPARPR